MTIIDDARLALADDPITGSDFPDYINQCKDEDGYALAGDSFESMWLHTVPQAHERPSDGAFLSLKCASNGCIGSIPLGP
jgi:hypothetical protein